jgi:hypothetical protein
MNETTKMTDAFQASLEMARGISSNGGIKGYGVIEVFRDVDPERPRNELKPDLEVPFANLITDAGDLYIAQAVIYTVGPANPGAPSPAKPNGMKLGTGTTSASKAGAGAALITYLTASNVAFDATFASTNNLGSTLGVEARYKTTWGAGVATNSALTEAVIVNDQATNATSSAANTFSRIVFTAINKGASDSLAITWAWKFLGA